MTEYEWLDIFSGNLASLLNDTNMSQRELADAAGLSEGTISKYIHKQQIPTLKAAINIAHALDIDISELVDFDAMVI